jgi:hypothetical protein
VELMVAVVIVGIATTGLAGMSLWAGRSGKVAQTTVARESVLWSATERLNAAPFEEMAEAAGCAEVEDGGFEFTRCVRVENPRDDWRRVTVFVAPHTDLVGPDSTTFDRSRAAPASPF